MHLLVVVALLGTVCGIYGGENLEYSSNIAFGAILLSFARIALYGISLRMTRPGTRRMQSGGDVRGNIMGLTIPLMSGIFFMFVGVGIVRVQFASEPRVLVCESVCTIQGEVRQSPIIKGADQIFIITKDDVGDVYDVQVKTSLYPTLLVGDRVTLTGRVSKPKSSMEHGRERSFDYSSYLHLRGVGSEMVYPSVMIDHIEDRDSSYAVRLQRWKEKLSSYISYYVDEPSASLAIGMLFGGQSMQKEIVDTFRVAGLSHIVVLSGFNIAIVISFVLLLLMFAPLVVRVIVALIFVILFVIMVGGEPSVIRATMMSSLALFALLLGRGYIARHALMISLFVITIYEPLHTLHDVSLHLSFLATAGIVYMSEAIHQQLGFIGSKMYRDIIATTLSAYLATLPYLLYTFGSMSVYALAANAIILPLVPSMILTSFLTVVLALVLPSVASIAGYGTTLLGLAIVGVSQLVVMLPFSSIHITISVQSMLLLYAVIGIALFIFISRRKKVEKNLKSETVETKTEAIISDVMSY